jgi:hypothetical protein
MALAIASGLLLITIAMGSGRRTRATLFVAGSVLAASLLVNGLDQYDRWFERRRGDPVREYQIVAKETLEFVGWSLVALALADASRERDERRRARTGQTGPIEPP